MPKKNKKVKIAKLKNRIGSPKKQCDPLAPPTYPLFQRIGIQTQNQCRNTLAKIMKLVLNGDLEESRAREGRFLLVEAINLNREVQLRARLDRICEHLKLPQELQDEDPDNDEAGGEDG